MSIVFAAVTSARFSIKCLLLFALVVSLKAELYGQQDSCVSYFQKSFNRTQTQAALGVTETSDGGVVIVGVDRGLNETDALISKFDKSGKLSWSYKLEGDEEFLEGIKETADKGLIMYGTTIRTYTEPSSTFLMKMDADGKVIWVRRFGKNGVSGLVIRDVIELSNGGFSLVGAYDFGDNSRCRLWIACTDNNGDLTWSKGYKTFERENGEGIVEDGNYLVASGHYFSRPNSFFTGFVIKVNKQTGAVIWANAYNVEGNPNTFHKIFLTPSGYTIDCIQEQPSKKVLVNIDRTGKPEKLLRINIPINTGRGTVYYSPAKGWTIGMGSIGLADVSLVHLSPAGVMEWAKKYAMPGNEVVSQVFQSESGTIYGAGWRDKDLLGTNDSYLFKTTDVGVAGNCNTVAQTATLDEPTCTQQSVSWRELPTDFDLPLAVQRTTVVYPLDENIICKRDTCYSTCPDALSCNQLILSGPTLICSLTDTITFSVAKNPSCLSTVTWSIDKRFAEIVSSTDAFFKVKFLKAGTLIIYAETQSSCNITKDSVSVAVNPATLALGPDSRMCENSSYTFTANENFDSYLWQDGSTEKTFTAKMPGLYFLQAVDACGNTQHDSVQVTGYYPTPTGFLDERKEYCQGTSTELSANGNWQTFSWSTGAVTRSVTVLSPGEYWLEVKSNEGCVGRDTIEVVEKPCISGIFFPNAFTPNHDGRNDYYQPIVHAVLEKYTLAIYNRYGHKVFETNDPNKGWDGTYYGKPQDSNLFVWVCRYKLAGEAGKTGKGTVAVIR